MSWDLRKFYDTGFSADVVPGTAPGDNVVDLAFSPSGDVLFSLTGFDSAHQFSLSSPWRINTAVDDSVSYDFGTEDSNPRSIRFNDDGTKLYMLGNGSNNVYQYTLGTAYDLSTISYDSVTKDVSPETDLGFGLFFSEDGSKMYVVGRIPTVTVSRRINEYTLSTPWDLSTASFSSNDFDVTSEDNLMVGGGISPDGTRIFLIGNENDSIYEYILSTPFDVSTGSLNYTLVVSGSIGLFVQPEGNFLFFALASSDLAQQYKQNANSSFFNFMPM